MINIDRKDFALYQKKKYSKFQTDEIEEFVVFISALQIFNLVSKILFW